MGHQPLFFDLKKVNAPAQDSPDWTATCQGPARVHTDREQFVLSHGFHTSARRWWVSGSKPDQTVETQKNKSATKKDKKNKRRCFLQSIKVTKVTAQYWQLWTSQEQGGRNESGGISAYHNIYATKKWTHAHMAASPIFFVSNSWQFARKWCSQLLNGRIWVGWQFQIN